MTDIRTDDRVLRNTTFSASPSALLALGCVGLMAGATPAIAQDEQQPQHLGGVTVTDTAIDDSYNRTESPSPKSTAPLIDTPQTINVIPRELIRDRGARTLAEVLRNTPGISFDAGENGFGTSTNNFTMRGFDTSGSVFIDNARDSGSYARDVFNVESVEVVKGPAADNGRGSAGGYVNINTKKPTLDRFISGDVSFGFDQYDSKSRKRGSIDINQPLGGTAAIRLNAVVEDSGVAGRELAKNKLWGVAPSVAIGLDTNFRAIVSWEHLERDDRPDWGVPGVTIRKKDYTNSVQSVFNPALADAPRDGYYGLASDYDDSTSDAILARLEYDIAPNVTLSNQTRWTRVKRDARFTTVTASPFTAPSQINTQTLFYERTNKTLNNLTNLSARFDTGGISHSLALGVEFTREKSTAGRFGSANPGPTDLFDPDPLRAGAVVLAPTQVARVKVDTIGFYLYDTIELSDQLQITGGVRGEKYDVEIDSLTAAGAPTGVGSYERDKFSWNGKIGVVFKPVENASIYASFGTSALPPGSFLSNPDISRTGDNAFPGFVPDAKPVRAHNYEIGVKWDLLGGALSATAALFRTEKRNVPVVGRDAGETANSLKGYHKQIVEGLELGLAGAITPEWNVFGGMLIMDSKRKISQTLEDMVRRANGSPTLSCPAVNPGSDYCREDGAIFTSTNGERLAFTPNFSASLWTTYRLPFGLTVGGGFQHVGSSYVGRPDDALRIIPNERYAKLRSYTIFNAMLAYDLTENINLRFNVDNIANKKYAVTSNWNARRVSLGAPRTYLLSAGFSF